MKDFQREEELRLWEEWKRTKNPIILENLIKKLEPIIIEHVNKWSGGTIPRYLLEMEARRIAYEAIKTYDPKKAALHTHLWNQLQRLSRFVYSYQNPARIPSEARIRKISMFEEALDFLRNQYHREPTIDEISDHLKWSKKEIMKLMKETAPEFPSQVGFSHIPAFFEQDEKAKRILDAIYYDLKDPKEKLMFEFLTGYGGRQQLTLHQISNRLGIPVSEVVKFKEKILNELRGIKL